MSGTTPTGTIIAFSGALPANPDTPTWVLCDGSPFAMNSGPYANLGSVLTSNFGGDGQTVFNVPDLRGRFLRGTSHGTPNDPDTASRVALMTGGNTGDAVGSAQAYATKNAGNRFAIESAGAHVHTAGNVPNNYENEAYGASGPAAWNITKWYDSMPVPTSTDGDHTHAITGGDRETRPANVYVHWLVAAVDVAGAPPIGSICAFAGDTTDVDVRAAINADGWYACNGDRLRIATNSALYAVIGKTYGGDDTHFDVPDLRGLFVLGAGGTANRAVGASQPSSMTGAPQTAFVTDMQGAHTHTLIDIPTDTHVADPVAGWKASINNPPGTTSDTQGAHTHDLSGGDAESRPLNVYVDYIIRFK
jgi:microcystin-dependent protein